MITCERTAGNVHLHSTILVIGVGHGDCGTCHFCTVIISCSWNVAKTSCMYGSALHIQRTALDGDGGVSCDCCTILYIYRCITIEGNGSIGSGCDGTIDINHVLHIAINILTEVA